MQILDKISFGFSRQVPTILQTEATECGLACIAMVAHYYGFESDSVEDLIAAIKSHEYGQGE